MTGLNENELHRVLGNVDVFVDFTLSDRNGYREKLTRAS